MKPDDARFNVFEALLDKEKIYLNPSLSFETICCWLGADPAEMDALLNDELGVGGRELLERLRASTPPMLSAKYGIKCFF